MAINIFRRNFMESQEYIEEIDFQKYLLILKRHWLPATFVSSMAIIVSVLVIFSKESIYEADGRLRFKRQNTTYSLVTEAGEKLGKLDSLNSKDTPLDTEAEVIRSKPIANQTINYLNLKDEKGNILAYEDFIKDLKLEAIRGTDILRIAYKSRNPEEAIKIVDTLMKVYIQKNIWDNRTDAAVAREFINKQLPQTEKMVREAEIVLRTFKEKNNIVELDQEAKATMAAIVDIDQRINLTLAEIEKNKGWATEMQSMIGMNSKEALESNALSQSLGIRQVFEKLKQAQEQLALERTRFLDDNPTIISLKEKEASLEAILTERVKQINGHNRQVSYKNIPIRNINQTENIQEDLVQSLVSSEVEHKALLNKVTSLTQIRYRYQERANSLPKLEQIQAELKRKVDTSRSSYELLLKNSEQLRLAENQNLTNAQIVNSAIASKFPVSPNRKIILALGLFGGSLLFVITAFGLEMANSSIRTTKELRNIFRYPLLGMIPCLPKKVPLIGVKTKWVAPEYQVRDLPHSFTAQIYGMLQAKLNGLKQNKKVKIILVTSSMPKEGKSTVSANLAMAFSNLGNQVLLIDADMYNPRQHQIWNLSNEVGLSNGSLNQSDLKASVKKVMPHLDVLPAGIISSNSASLLSSKRVDLFIEFFEKSYDFVIIDTSPLLLTADALNLIKMSDGVVLVVRPGVIDRAIANATKELLEQSSQDVLGLVVNSVMAEQGKYFYHGKVYCESNGK